jgi:hypothetical protein
MQTFKKWFLVLFTTIFFCSGLLALNSQFDKQILSTDFFQSVFNDTYPANVTRLNLSRNVVFIKCDSSESRCSENKEKIDIWTEAIDPENDTLLYLYKVSGGEIVGKGEKVVWDLSNVEPGEYKITAGVDDGCGVCGETKTRTVYVLECPKDSYIGYPSGVVNSVNTDQEEIFEVCQVFSKKKQKNCSEGENPIKVSTNTNVEDEHKAVFKYDVTGGRIIGNGANVEWDLSKAEPGTYVVTASVDVGSGFCSESKSTIVKVVECDKCKKRK